MLDTPFTLSALNDATKWYQASRTNASGIFSFRLIDGGSFSGKVVTFECKTNPTTTSTDISSIAAVECAAPTVASTTASAVGTCWRVDAAGGVYVRARLSTAGTGLLTVEVSGSDG